MRPFSRNGRNGSKATDGNGDGHAPDRTTGGEEVVKPPPGEVRAGPGGGRWNVAGIPMEKSRHFKSSARRLADRLLPKKWLAIIVVGLAIASAGLMVYSPKLLGEATDIVFSAFVQDDDIDFDALHRKLFIALGLYVGSALLSFVQSFVLAGIVQRMLYKLRSDVEDKLHRLPLPYIDKAARGDLMSRVTNDMDNMSMTLNQTLSQMLSSVLMLVGTLVMMVVISPVLAIASLVTIPLSMLTMQQIAKRAKSKFMAQWRHTGDLNTQVEETFTGHTVVKAFGRQFESEERFRAKNQDLYEASFGAQVISGSIQPVMTSIGTLNYVLIAVIGSFRIASGALSLGGLQAFVQYSRQFSQPLTQLASMMNMLQSGVASAERIFELLDADEESPDGPTVLAGQPVRGRVEFDRVSFSYDPKVPLIEELSLVAEPGQTIAIVGHTGAGKTTLVNLIMRFYELDAGEIRLDGKSIATIPRHELRSNIGMVLQDTWLFGGTIRENIAYGNPSASEEEILAAAKATFVDRFVHSLPDGYDTVIDGEGSNVSAGEKQLLTIARAFLANPAILILDEATSSVDTRTEVLVQEAMKALRSQRTSFVIAHRLSTIRGADIILVMDAGRIVEQGNHTDLLARGGAYAELYNAQFAAPVVDLDLDLQPSASPS